MGGKGKRKQREEDDLDETGRAAPKAGREEGPDDEGDDIHAGVVSQEKDLKPGDYEVEDPDGSITIIRGDRLLSQEEIESEDDRVINAAKADKRFDKITAHRRLRFKDILDRGKAASELEHQNEFDFSDDWKGMKGVSKRYSGMIECKHGNYVETSVGSSGIPRVRHMSESELQKAREIDATDSKPCGCVVCTKRRENSATIAPAPGLRSGKKLGWDKYGRGRTLED